MTIPEFRPVARLLGDELIDELARIDEQSAVDNVASSDLDPTIRSLKAGLDTLASEICDPPPVEPYEDESDCQRVIDLVAAIGREPSLTTEKAVALADENQLDIEQIGPYRLLARLGQGGMGTVYKALHTRLRRVVAVKVLPAERMRDPAAIARFDREMQAVGQLDHPNIVRASDADEKDGVHYLVMEYVEGLNLSQLSRRVGPLPVADACELARQAAVGLQYASEKGLVHRDIKPSNLMLAAGSDGPPTLKILDMGLALLDERYAHRGGELTTSHQTMGTLDYMAPEQGSDTHNVDIRADIYSLGATLFKLLTGAAPFGGKQYDAPIRKMMALANENVPSLAERRDDLPDGLVALVDSMLQKNRDQRPATPSEVAERLTPYTTGCDCSSLLERAIQTNRPQTEVDQSVASTGNHFTSGSIETAPTFEREMEREPVRSDQSPAGDKANVPKELATTVHFARLSPAARRRGLLIGAAIALIVALGSGLYFSGILFNVKTSGGMIVLEGDPAVLNDVSVTVDGEQVTFKFDGKEIHVDVDQQSGKLRVVSKSNDQELLAKEFQFRAGQNRLPFKVRFEPAQTSDSADPDRVVAEMVLKLGGVVNFHSAAKQSASRIEDLPKGRFALRRVVLPDTQPASGAMIAAISTLKHLDALVISGVSDSGAKSLSKLDSLRDLVLQGSKTSDETVRHLSRLSGVRTLRISRANISDIACQHLAKMTQLRVLSLGQTLITDAGLERLSSLKHLTFLRIDRCPKISGANLSVLKRLQFLGYLDLSDTSVSDEALDQLKQLEQVSFLNLLGTPITNAGVASLQQSLPDCTVLHDSMPATEADRKAAKWVLDNKGTLATWPNRTVEQLSSKPFSVWKIEFLGERVPQSVDIDLSGLRALRTLRWQYMSNADSQAKQIGKLRQLRELDLSYSDISSAGISQLKHLQNLESLTLSNCKNVNDTTLAELRPLSELTVVRLSHTAVTDEGLVHLAELKELELLNLTHCASFQGSGLRHLAGLPRLQQLYLYDSPITDDAVEHLKQMQSLRVLWLHKTKVSAAAAAELQKALPDCLIFHEALERDGASI